MCDPVTALAVLSASVGAYGQRQAAEAQQDALLAQNKLRQEEITASAEEDIGQRVREAQQQRARLLVAAGESGVSGNSFEAQLIDSLSQQSRDTTLIAKQTAFNKRATNAQTNSALAGVSRPSLLGTGLQIASAGVDGYVKGQTIKQRKTKGA